MANLKVGREIYDINKDDIVLFNGACWQLITRKVFNGWHEYSPTMSKTLCKKLLNKNILVLIKKEAEYVTASGEQMGLYYYKFDIERLNDFIIK